MNDVQHALFVAGDYFLAAQPLINCALGLGVAAYLLHRLLCCGLQYNRAERAGMGAIAGGMILATPALWLASTPFDEWSFNVARFGVAIYVMSGGMRRDRHRLRNMAQEAYAEGFRDGRVAGKVSA